MANVPDSKIKDLLTQYKKITVYGLSPDPEKPSHYVPVFMRERGYEVVGIYPKEHQIGGFKIYKSLAEVPNEFRKFVDVFRASEKISEVVDEVLKIGGVEVLWLQLGITNIEGEGRAERAGIKVVSDRCLIPSYKKWMNS